MAPLTHTDPQLTIGDAYVVSRRLLDRRVSDGERLIGKKIGVTSQAVQQMLNVHQPDFGYLTDRMVVEDGGDMPISTHLIQPRAEGELALLLKSDLIGPGVSPDQVLDAVEWVMPCFEVVDSRIRNWEIRIQDTIADNASSGMFVLGKDRVAPQQLDLKKCLMRVYKNGVQISEGRGEAALGSPLNSVAWLANTLGAYGVPLRAGEVILSGSLVPLEPVTAGDAMRVVVDGLGEATVQFT